MRPSQAALAALTALALLVGCGGQEPLTASAPPDPGPHPVVAVPQAQRVLDAVDEVVGASARTRDPALFGPRVLDPYAKIASARYRVEVATKAPATPAPSVDRTRLIVPEQAGWPRFFLTVGSSSAQSTPILRVLRSADARTPYGLTAELTMFPGSTLPAAAGADDGALPLAPDDDTLAMTPVQVLERYADVLTKGDTSAHAAQFSSDVFRQQLGASLARRRVEVAKLGGSVTVVRTVVPDSVLAVALADGSALVIGELAETSTSTIKPAAGSLVAQPDFAALAGRSTFTKTLVRTSAEVIGFVVPPQGPVTAIAAQQGTIAVTGS